MDSPVYLPLTFPFCLRSLWSCCTVCREEGEERPGTGRGVVPPTATPTPPPTAAYRCTPRSRPPEPRTGPPPTQPLPYESTALNVCYNPRSSEP